MALFADGGIASIDDLGDQDSGLLDVAASEAINLTTKLTLAKNEIGIELTALFERARSSYTLYLGQAGLDLQHIAVTPPLHQWVVFQALAMTYRDAYYNQLNDRYRGKWSEYRSLAGWARQKLLETGIGIVFDPIPQASQPVLTLFAAAGQGGTVYARASFTNAAGEEGSASTTASLALPSGNGISIQPINAPANARGWNVFVGSQPTVMYLQNPTPLDVSAVWQYTSSTAAATGRPPSQGQGPNVIRLLPRMLQRG